MLQNKDLASHNSVTFKFLHFPFATLWPCLEIGHAAKQNNYKKLKFKYANKLE